MSSLVIIAPFDNLAAVAQETCAKLGEPIPLIRTNLDDVVSHAIQAERDGVEVIISRGTAAWKMVEAGIRVPIVQIPITGYDLLRAVMEARELGRKIGIADIPEVLHGVESIESIFHWKIEKYPIYSLSDVELSVQSLIDKGIDVLIGKYVYVQMLKNTGIHTVVLSSGPESIMQAIQEAKQVLEVRRAEATRTKQLQAILDFIGDGVIAVDQEGRVTVFNRAVEKLFNLPASDMIGQKIDDILAGSRIMNVLQTGIEELNRIQEEKGLKIIANRIPIQFGDEVIGVVSTFQELSKLQQQEQEIRKKLAYRGHVTKYRLDEVVGQSPAFLQAIEKMKKYAHVDFNMLLTGETGVGKEVFAHLIHSYSSRAEGPFVAVNCAAIPETLLESELFGYVEGAFTGAKKGGKVGLFELAHGGTIFLDEIGELAESLQVRLLRVLQEGEVMRLGDERVIPINIRVVTATNRDLEERISQGQFRADLFYRINTLNIHIPALRERKEDISLLCQYFLSKIAFQIRKHINGFDLQAMLMMQEYHWPGNIRQLRNFVERAVILTTGEWITEDIVREAGGKSFDAIGNKLESMRMHKESVAQPVNPACNLQRVEKDMILQVLEKVGGNRTEAAKILGIGRSTLWRKLNER